VPQKPYKTWGFIPRSTLLNRPQGIMQPELVPQSPSFYSLLPVFSLPCSLAPLFPVFVILSESRHAGTSRRTCICFCICLSSPVPSPSVPVFLLPTPYSLFPVFVIPSEAFFSGAEGPAFVFRPESLSPSVPVFLLPTPYSLLPIPCICHPERSVLQRSRGTCFCFSSPVPSPLVPASPFPCSLSLSS
jgi:hypothetical protein